MPSDAKRRWTIPLVIFMVGVLVIEVDKDVPAWISITTLLVIQILLLEAHRMLHERNDEDDH